MLSRTMAWLALIVPLGILVIVLSEMRLLDPFENSIGNIVIPAEQALHRMMQWVPSDNQHIADSEIESLRQENEHLQSELARLRDVEFRYKELSRLMQVTESRPDDRFLTAKVITYDPSSLKDRLALNVGRSNGVKEGMPVISEGGSLVGTVSRVYNNFAWVTLITDPQSSINALVQPSRAQGVVSGGPDQELRMELVRQQEDIKPGDTVVTSGLGGTYPSSLLLGQITSVKGNPQDILQEVHLKSSAHLTQLETVLVLVSFQPARLSTP